MNKFFSHGTEKFMNLPISNNV